MSEELSDCQKQELLIKKHRYLEIELIKNYNALTADSNWTPEEKEFWDNWYISRYRVGLKRINKKNANVIFA